LTYMVERINRSVKMICQMMKDEIKQSDFRPFACEQKIGMGEGTPPALPIPFGEGKNAYVRGIIDRIDIYRSGDDVYVRVDDYKTGSKIYSKSDIPLGINTQLFLYLFSLWKCPPCEFRDRLLGGAKNIIPAGAMYISVRPGEANSDTMVEENEAKTIAESSSKRSGVFLSTEEILRAMEPDLQGKYIPVKEKKEGVIQENNLLDAEGFALMYKSLTDTISEIVGRMAQGNAEALPLKHGDKFPCEYCKLKMVCQNIEGKCRFK